MAKRAAAATSLGELEMAVLQHLWERGSGDTSDVHAAIGKKRKITYNTIQSTLKRLHQKNLLDRTKVGHAFVYSPRLSRQEYGRAELERVIDGVLGGRADSMVAAFIDLTERAGEEQLRRLEQAVAARLASQSEEPS